MAVRLHRASGDELAALLASSRKDSLTYAPPGGSLGDVTPVGLRRHHWTTNLSDSSFERGVEALRSWSMHRGSGLELVTDGPIAVGTNVVLNAPLPVGFVDATCRIVEVVDETDRFGFAYGTLSIHPERGEQAFVIERKNGTVRFDVIAVSAPAHPLARALPFLADRLQHIAVRRYQIAMERIVSANA